MKCGLTVWIAQSKNTYVAKSHEEVKKHPYYRGKYSQNQVGDPECQSIMGAPLVAGDEVLGVLKVESKRRTVNDQVQYTYFSEQDQILFDLVKDSTANAVKFVKANERLEEVTGEIFLLMLNAFAHRGRNILAKMKALISKEKRFIDTLPDPESTFPIGTRRRMHTLLTETRDSIDVLMHLYMQYERWFGRGDARERFSVKSVIDAAQDEVKQEWIRSNKPVDINKDIDSDIPHVWGKPSVLEYVIHELLRNAGKYGAARVRIAVRELQNQGFIEIVVSDDGFGISSELREAFKQQRLMRTNDRTEGGLGLLLSRRFIEQENGKFILEDTSRDFDMPGACFTIVMPIAAQT